jgi:hypothetical protein
VVPVRGILSLIYLSPPEREDPGRGGVDRAGRPPGRESRIREGGLRSYRCQRGNPDPYSEDNWNREGWTYAEGAYHQLVRLGVTEVFPAPAPLTERGRTYESAVSVKEALGKLGIVPRSINVFTFGSHARRSRLV